MRRNILDTYMIPGGVPYYWKFLQREYTNLRWMTCLHFDAPRMYRTITSCCLALLVPFRSLSSFPQVTRPLRDHCI